MKRAVSNSRSRRRSYMRGGGCGCGGNIFSQNKFDNSEITASKMNFSQLNGGNNQQQRRRRIRSEILRSPKDVVKSKFYGDAQHRSKLKQRGGGWDSFFTGNYTLNPISNFGNTSGAYPNANMLYGKMDVDPSPNKQPVSFYNSANMRVA